MRTWPAPATPYRSPEETLGEPPGVAFGRLDPQVERAAGCRGLHADRVEHADHQVDALAVARPLLLDVAVVVQRDGRRGLHRSRHHHAHVLADLGQVGDQLRVAGVEAGAHTGEVGALRQ